MPKHRLQQSALKVTRWVGSPQSIVAHTIIFIASFGAVWFGVLNFDRMLLILTTVVSLEAIYLAIFIQMTINVQQESLQEVEQDIGEIQEDIDEIQFDVDEIQENVDEIQEDVGELAVPLPGFEAVDQGGEVRSLDQIKEGLQKLTQDIERLQNKS